MSALENTVGHIPVLLDEVVAALAPAPGTVLVDATFGAGGYTRRLLDAIPNRRTSLRKRIKIAPTAQWPTGSDKKAAPPAKKEE